MFTSKAKLSRTKSAFMEKLPDSMKRRTFLTGLAGILASGIAPAVIRSGVLMPMHRIILPDELTPAEARRLLGTCDMRFVRVPPAPAWVRGCHEGWTGRKPQSAAFDLEVEVKILDRWMHLGRTDYCDNVATYNYEDGQRNLEATRRRYLCGIHNSLPGARINEWSHGTSFSVIDALSDG